MGRCKILNGYRGMINLEIGGSVKINGWTLELPKNSQPEGE